MSEPDEIEIDAFKEVFNIGVGYAADSLSQMVKEPVILTIPELSLACGKTVIVDRALPHAKEYSMVSQQFSGDLNAEAVIMFPVDKSLELVRLMVGEEIPAEEMNAMEQETLTEIGNILLNSCISTISNTIGSQFQCSMPRYLSGNMNNLFPDHLNDDDCLLTLNIDLLVESKQIHGHMMFLMKMDSLDTFKHAVMKYLGLAK